MKNDSWQSGASTPSLPLKMRELEALTGVNRESIRVLFREGLLPEPSRPARNVANYGEAHVKAILAVRKLQQESNMSLRQIKLALNGDGPGLQTDTRALTHLEKLVTSRFGVGNGTVPLGTLSTHNPKAYSDARTLARLGIIKIIAGKNGHAVSVTDSALIKIWARMREVGFNEEQGFPPEILDFYIQAAEFVADNEARIFLQQADGRLGEDEAADMLVFALPMMLDFFGILRQKFFLQKIGEKSHDGMLATHEASSTRRPVTEPGRKVRPSKSRTTHAGSGSHQLLSEIAVALP